MTEEGEEEEEEEVEEDTLGYLTLLLPVPLWLFDLLGGVTPLLQVGLSDPLCVAGSVAGAEAEAGGAGVTVLGLWGADGQAADLAVCTVHHLHKLATPKKEGGPGLCGSGKGCCGGTVPMMHQDSLPLPQPLSYGEASDHAMDLRPPFTHVVLDVVDKRLLAKVCVYDLTRSLEPHSGVQGMTLKYHLVAKKKP
ncbi:hypothetical protein F7725_022460 [Dissostichus mawsoni]|uniref:Uncharacterized protein n=1 Tax=Dissostichus mawsoni TaxID=36200 RepID=A0A7J5YY09_DISMA|nr:hypothetical protein F7725_022460 [Dissostichus mawsoni]